MSERGRRPGAVLFGLAVALPVLLLLAVGTGETRTFTLGESLRGIAATCGLAAPLESPWQGIVEVRFFRALVGSTVGASLSLSGGLLQGLFRNPLASPSVLGVTSGASLGATIAVILVGGYGPELFVTAASAMPLVIVPLAAFAGAMLVTVLVWRVGAGTGSAATLLLTGIAVATLCGGCVQVLQAMMLETDYEVQAAIVAWMFGTLDDRSAAHVVPLFLCLAFALMGLPFLHRELDILAFGEADAEALGVNPRRVKALTVVLSSLLAGTAVAIAGQITFVGLVVPNLVRMVVGPRHGRLLPAAALFGACFLLAVDTLQRGWLVAWHLRPGVLMSLIGAPIFLLLLARLHRKEGWW